MGVGAGGGCAPSRPARGYGGSAASSPIGVWGGAPEALALLFVQLLCSKAIRNLITFHEQLYTVDLNLLSNNAIT